MSIFASKFSTCRNLGEGMTVLLTDKQKLTAAIAGFTVLALGIYSSREGTKVAGRAIDRCSVKPLPVCPCIAYPS